MPRDTADLFQGAQTAAAGSAHDGFMTREPALALLEDLEVLEKRIARARAEDDRARVQVLERQLDRLQRQCFLSLVLHEPRILSPQA